MTSDKTDEHVLVASVGDSAAGGCFPGWIWFVVVVLVARRCRKGVDGERDPLAIRWLGSSMAGEQTKSEWLKTETQVGIFKRGMNWMKKEAEVRIEIGFSWKSSSKFVMRMRSVCFFFFRSKWKSFESTCPGLIFVLKSVRIQNLLKGSETFCRMWASELPATGPWSCEAGTFGLWIMKMMWKWCEKVNFKMISRYLCKLGSWFAQCCTQLCGSSGSSGARVSWFFPAFRTLRPALSWMISGWSWGLSRCYRSVWSNWNCEMNCRRGVHRRCTKLYPGIPVSSKTWRHARVWAMVKSEVGLDPGRPINDIVSNSTGTEQKISWGLCKFRLVSV